MSEQPKTLVLAMTGASGSPYGVRLLDVLLRSGHTVHLTLSRSAARVLHWELGVPVDLDHLEPLEFVRAARAALGLPQPETDDAQRLRYHDCHDFRSGLASGSFPTDGMVICPCSLATLSKVATGTGSNLIHRAADVHLKERRRLVVVPRETPLHSIHLENMRRLAEAGAVVLPAMPGFYHRPTRVLDLVDFVVARICDHLGVRHQLVPRWGQ